MLRVGKTLTSVLVAALTALGLTAGQAEAAELNLTGVGSICTASNGVTCAQAGFSSLGSGFYMFAGAMWSVTNTQPTGSGYIDSFVRIQDASAPDQLIVDGHNTSAPQSQYLNDEKPGPTFTHDVLTADMQSITINNIQYYQFLLDINQTGTDPLLSLSGLQICTASSGGMLFDGTCAGTANGGKTSVMRYDLDGSALNFPDAQPTDATASATNTVRLDYSKNSGSGSGDLFVYIPYATLFPTGTAPGGSATDYLYLWSQFGLPSAYGNNDGYEEWAFRHKGSGSDEPFNGSAVPEPTTLVMLGTGLLFGAAAVRRRNRKLAADAATTI